MRSGGRNAAFFIGIISLIGTLFRTIFLLFYIVFPMNIVFFVLFFASLAYMLFTDPSGATAAALAGAENAVTLSLKMLAVYVLWLGVLGVMRRNGVANFISRIFRPITKRAFKGETPETQQLIAENLAANFLGIGSVATPLGIEAVKAMQGERADATFHTALFIVINACGVQLLPATIIALRQQAGSASPADIFLPTVISTLLTATIGVTLCYLTRGRRKGSRREIAP